MDNFIDSSNSSSKSFFILLILTVLCAFSLQFIALFLGITSIYLLFAISTISTFLLPAILLQKLETNTEYFPFNAKTNAIWYIVAIIFMVVFSPLMEYIGEWNRNMQLPTFLESIQAWMQAKEDEMALLTENVIMVDSIGKLLLNILVMAVLPAVAEEYYFRGSLMNIIQRAVKNEHISIWLTAIIFSAIHVQFFGFFPRMILGVFFGYMLIWTKNIWIPVLAHFVNNAAVTVFAYYYTIQGKTYADMQTYESYPIIVYLGSFIVAVALASWSYKKLVRENFYGKGLD